METRQPIVRTAFSPFHNRTDAIFSPSGSVDFFSVAYSPNGLYYAKELEPHGEGNIGIFDAENKEMLLSIKVQYGNNDLKGIAWSPDSLVISVMYHGGNPSGIVFYDTERGELLRRLEISEDYHFMVFGKESHILYLSKEGEDYTEINLRNTDFSKYSGVNLPWINYGWDVGRNPWGMEHGGFSSNRNRLLEDFSFLRDNGVKVVRLFIFCDLRSGILFNQSGIPLKFDTFVEEDFNVLVDTAKKTGLLLIPVLFDYTIADGVNIEGVTRVGEFPELFTDPVKQKDLLKIFGAFFRKFASHPAIFAWDIINEPEHIESVSEKNMYEFVSGFVKLIHKYATEAKITVGLLNRNNVNRWVNFDLDIYQFHYFDSFDSLFPLNFPVVNLGVDKPVIAGELETTDIHNKLTILWNNGYKGGLFWALNDGEFRQNARLFHAWISIH